MQLHQLKYFVAVAEVRHFTQAADIVGITQPSLSKQVHALETDLGAPLFERVRGNITLTAAGEVLLPLAKRILADVDTATREVQELVGLRRGRVRLGATPSLATSLAPPVLRRFRDAHPGVDLRVEEGGSQDLVRDLLARRPRPRPDHHAGPGRRPRAAGRPDPAGEPGGRLGGPAARRAGQRRGARSPTCATSRW